MQKYIAIPLTVENALQAAQNNLASLQDSGAPKSQIDAAHAEVDAAQAEFDKYGLVDMTAEEIAEREAEEIAGRADDFNRTVSEYRDEKIAQPVAFHNGTTSFQVMNDTRTRSALLEKINTLLLMNNQDMVVNWKCLDGYCDLNAADLQGLYLACDTRNQKCFDAARHVTEINATVPYEDFNNMKADFDTYMEE